MTLDSHHLHTCKSFSHSFLNLLMSLQTPPGSSSSLWKAQSCEGIIARATVWTQSSTPGWFRACFHWLGAVRSSVAGPCWSSGTCERGLLTGLHDGGQRLTSPWTPSSARRTQNKNSQRFCTSELCSGTHTQTHTRTSQTPCPRLTSQPARSPVVRPLLLWYS